MKKQLLLLKLCFFSLLTFNSCSWFATYGVEGDCVVTTQWTNELDDYSDYDKFMINEGSNYLTINIVFETTDYSVSFGSKLEDFNCRIEMMLPYGKFEKETKFKKGTNGNYFISFKVITAIKDDDMYNPTFHGQYTFYIYDVSMINFNQPYQIYPERPFRETVSFTYPDGTTPDDWRDSSGDE